MARRRRFVPILLAVVVVGLFGSTLWVLWSKARPKPVAVETGKPVVTDIVRKTVAAGAIQPRKEIEIKPRVAGILKKLGVEAGQRIHRGDLVAEIEIIPDVVSLNEAKLRLSQAGLGRSRAKRELTRAEQLGVRGAGTGAEIDRLRADLEQAEEEVKGAELRVRLVKEGATSRGKGASTRVESTVDGTVLAVLVREGASVINANSFNPGTTIVTVADMSNLVFKGRVDEAEVGKVHEGMPVEILVSALADRTFEGKLERIAPKSVAKEGSTEFEIEVAFSPPSDVVVRAGYSANANIVLDRRDKVLAIDEGLVTFDADRRFVEVDAGGGRYQRREVKLGLSDGIKVEVVSGVKPGEILRKPDRTPTPPGRGG